MNYLVTTPCGPVQGTAGRIPGTAAYKGIRYATAGRWEYPRQVTHWDGVYDGAAYGHCSYQPRAFYHEEEVPEKAFYYHEFRKGETYTYSEDCLFLNIWTPDTAKEGDKLPVLVYIHGGGFTGGCGHEKHFDGPVWPAKGVIGVTLNYRLGPLGFLCLPELKEEAGYAWFFDRKLPGDDNGAWHSSDLWYWFGTLEHCWRPMTEKDYALSGQMTDYLCNFAKTGNPNRTDLPEWVASGKGQTKVLRLGEGDPRMDKPSKLKLFYTMLTNKAVGE